MSELQVLCVSMHQKDFSLVDKMNIKTDAIISNQCDETSYNKCVIENNVIELISSETRGVGINRNIGLANASGRICLLSDDDMVLRKDYESMIIRDFDNHPDADLLIFNIGTTTPEFGRIPTVTRKFKRLRWWNKNPYGAPRVAFRLNSIRRTNIYFSELFGGGALFPSGEDSLWIAQLLNAGLKIFISPTYIGDVSYSQSSWHSSDEKRIKYGQGALLEARPIPFKFLFSIYYSIKKSKNMTIREAYNWIRNGRRGYRELTSYELYVAKEGKR